MFILVLESSANRSEDLTCPMFLFLFEVADSQSTRAEYDTLPVTEFRVPVYFTLIPKILFCVFYPGTEAPFVVCVVVRSFGEFEWGGDLCYESWLAVLFEHFF